MERKKRCGRQQRKKRVMGWSGKRKGKQKRGVFPPPPTDLSYGNKVFEKDLRPTNTGLHSGWGTVLKTATEWNTENGSDPMTTMMNIHKHTTYCWRKTGLGDWHQPKAIQEALAGDNERRNVLTGEWMITSPQCSDSEVPVHDIHTVKQLCLPVGNYTWPFLASSFTLGGPIMVGLFGPC